MQTDIRRGLLGALFAGGLLALSCTAASASEPLEGPPITAKTSGDHSIASGNQVIAPVTAPVTVGAVSAAVLGDSTAINKDGNHKGSVAGPRINAVTSGDHSILSGNQVIAPVIAPVTVGAVSAAVLGDSTAINKNGGYSKDGGYKDGKFKDGNHKGAVAGPRINAVTSGDHSIASGNQVIAPVTAPVTVGAVSAAVLGDSTAINKNGGYSKDGNHKGSVAGPRINAVTSGDHSIASGNQVIAPVTAPVTVGAVSAAVLGDSTAINKNGGYKNEKPKDDGYKNDKPKDDGYKNDKPKDDGYKNDKPKDGNHKGGDKGSMAGPQINAVTSGDHSIASGNQVIVPVTAPVTVGAVSAAVLGDSTAINKDGGNHKDGNYKDGNHKGGDKGSMAGPRINAVTSGDHSIASGNQVIAPVTAPVTVGAVSAAVLGDSTVINKNGGNHKDGGYKDGGYKDGE